MVFLFLNESFCKYYISSSSLRVIILSVVMKKVLWKITADLNVVMILDKRIIVV